MTSIFVGKLDFNATEQQVKEVFEQYGKVNRVTIGKDRETQKPKGFAFVEMFDENEAEQAIEALDNSEINGRSVAVKKADDRSGGKPANAGQGGFQRRDNIGSGKPGDFKSDYKKTDDIARKGPSLGPDDLSASAKAAKKKDKPGERNDAPKKKKMETYKKSGKSEKFFGDDDDEDLESYYNSSNTGWNDEEE